MRGDSRFSGDTTADLLRQLADQIERKVMPDFMLVVNAGGEYSTAHYAGKDALALIGAIELRKNMIIDGVGW